ncbi:alpha/beta fold hydrolase [Streptomyces sp. NPDC018045]|uniref:alpha/beta fold hydrolase n=1 Tax=Streptomyces sp. NPDC018045 TaxID=3365037 RepID=UPI00379D36F0
MNDATPARRAAVLRAWRDTLKADAASDDEDFFAAGGNSILVVAFQRRLSEALGHRVTLRQIHDHPTVGGLLGLTAPPSSGTASAAPDDGGAPGLTLYCLPYAGASARIYEPWAAKLPPTVTVRPLELPGRGARWTDPPARELGALLTDLAGAMDEARQAPYAVFGHSFGGILAYELTRHLLAHGFPAPRRLLVSACLAPHDATPAETNHDLPDAELTARLRALRGTPEELLSNPELMELYLPVIRADYTILDHYRAPAADPLDCPVSVFCGADDREADRAAADAWTKYTHAAVTVEEIDGDHFFLRDHEDAFLARLAAHLVTGP